MNLDELENNRQDDQNFQDNSNKGMEIESPSVDHSITEYAEPDYGNDFSNEELNQENPEEFDNDELEGGQSTEFDNEEEFDDEDQEDLDEDDETFTNPERNE